MRSRKKTAKGCTAIKSILPIPRGLNIPRSVTRKNRAIFRGSRIALARRISVSKPEENCPPEPK